MDKVSVLRGGRLRGIGLMRGGEVRKEGLRLMISTLADDLADGPRTLNAYSAKSPTERIYSPRTWPHSSFDAKSRDSITQYTSKPIKISFSFS